MNITQTETSTKLTTEAFVASAKAVESLIENSKNPEELNLAVTEYYAKNKINYEDAEFITQLVYDKRVLDSTNYEGLISILQKKVGEDKVDKETLISEVKNKINSNVVYTTLVDVLKNSEKKFLFKTVVPVADLNAKWESTKDLIKTEVADFVSAELNSTIGHAIDSTNVLSPDVTNASIEAGLNEFMGQINFGQNVLELVPEKAKGLGGTAPKTINELVDNSISIYNVVIKNPGADIKGILKKLAILHAYKYTESLFTRGSSDIDSNIKTNEFSATASDSTFPYASKNRDISQANSQAKIPQIQALDTTIFKKRKFDIGTLLGNLFNGSFLNNNFYEGDWNLFTQVVLEKLADTDIAKSITTAILSLRSWNNLYDRFSISDEIKDLFQKFTFAPEVNYNFTINFREPTAKYSKTVENVTKQYKASSDGFNFKSDLRYDLFSNNFERFMNLCLVSAELPSFKYTTVETAGVYGIKEMNSAMSGFEFENVTLKFISNNTWDLYNYFIAYNNRAYNFQNRTIGYPANYKFDLQIKVYIDSFYENPNNVAGQSSTYISYILKDCFIRSIDKDEKNASKHGDVSLKTFSIGLNYKTFTLQQRGEASGTIGGALAGFGDALNSLSILPNMDSVTSTVTLYKVPPNVINPFRV